MLKLLDQLELLESLEILEILEKSYGRKDKTDAAID
jgi:hypothetical protein